MKWEVTGFGLLVKSPLIPQRFIHKVFQSSFIIQFKPVQSWCTFFFNNCKNSTIMKQVQFSYKQLYRRQQFYYSARVSSSPPLSVRVRGSEFTRHRTHVKRCRKRILRNYVESVFWVNFKYQQCSTTILRNHILPFNMIVSCLFLLYYNKFLHIKE